MPAVLPPRFRSVPGAPSMVIGPLAVLALMAWSRESGWACAMSKFPAFGPRMLNALGAKFPPAELRLLGLGIVGVCGIPAGGAPGVMPSRLSSDESAPDPDCSHGAIFFCESP